MLNPVIAGRAMIGVAIVGVVASLVAGVIGGQLVTDFEDGLEQSLALSAEVLETVDDSFEVAGDALDILTTGVADAEGAERLAVASDLVTQYSQRTAQAREVVDDQR